LLLAQKTIPDFQDTTPIALDYYVQNAIYLYDDCVFKSDSHRIRDSSGECSDFILQQWGLTELRTWFRTPEPKHACLKLDEVFWTHDATQGAMIQYKPSVAVGTAHMKVLTSTFCNAEVVYGEFPKSWNCSSLPNLSACIYTIVETSDEPGPTGTNIVLESAQTISPCGWWQKAGNWLVSIFDSTLKYYDFTLMSRISITGDLRIMRRQTLSPRNKYLASPTYTLDRLTSDDSFWYLVPKATANAETEIGHLVVADDEMWVGQVHIAIHKDKIKYSGLLLDEIDLVRLPAATNSFSFLEDVQPLPDTDTLPTANCTNLYLSGIGVSAGYVSVYQLATQKPCLAEVSIGSNTIFANLNPSVFTVIQGVPGKEITINGHKLKFPYDPSKKPDIANTVTSLKIQYTLVSILERFYYFLNYIATSPTSALKKLGGLAIFVVLQWYIVTSSIVNAKYSHVFLAIVIGAIWFNLTLQYYLLNDASDEFAQSMAG
jgi:hypothetical protein